MTNNNETGVVSQPKAPNQFGLLATRRFLPLFLTQFLGAFNDNALKERAGDSHHLRCRGRDGSQRPGHGHHGRGPVHPAVLSLFRDCRPGRRQVRQSDAHSLGKGRRDRAHGACRRRLSAAKR